MTKAAWLGALAGCVLVVGAMLGGCAMAEQQGETEPGSPRPLEAVLEEHAPRLMAIPGVVGTAQGSCEGIPCVKVYVAEKTEELLGRIPDTIEGYQVVVEESGPFRAL